jgi:hypothetical protein
MPVGPIDPATKRGWSGVRRGHVELARLFLDAPLAQAVRRRLKGARLDDVAADREKRFVDRLDDVGARQHEVIVAAFERLAAEVLGRGMEPLDVRSHGAIEDDDAFSQRGEVRG